MITTTRKATGTTMGRKRPRSKLRRSGGSAKPPSTDVGTQRTRGDSPRSLLLTAIGVSALAALDDFAAGAFTMSEFRKCGHVHFDVLLTFLGVAFTGMALWTWREWWRLRRTRRSQAPSTRIQR